MDIFEKWILEDSPRINEKERTKLFLLFRAAQLSIYEETHEWHDPKFPYIHYIGSEVSECTAEFYNILAVDNYSCTYTELVEALETHIKNQQ